MNVVDKKHRPPQVSGNGFRNKINPKKRLHRRGNAEVNPTANQCGHCVKTQKKATFKLV